tara:strand:+ start:995 stop:1273 length:279 start_codon:yes stop_codon:yes gene_type:complete
MLWTSVFFVVLVLVHIQFKYCARIAVGALKLIETSIIVLIIRAYAESDIIWDYLGNLAEILPDIPWDIPWDSAQDIWDKMQVLYKYQASAQE